MTQSGVTLPTSASAGGASRAVAVIVIAGVILGFTAGLSTALAGAILVSGIWLVAKHQIFSVEGYLCLLAIYYWLGIANPFDADVHQVTFPQATIVTLAALVVGGLALVWIGARAGRRSAARTPSQAYIEPQAFVERLYQTAYLAMGMGASIALLCYLRFGVPALSGSPDSARTDFISHLSPFTYYQWLFIEVGIGLGILAVAQDNEAGSRSRRRILGLVCGGMLILVSGVFSRVTIGTPVMIAAIVWWSQGRRFPLALVAAGAAALIAVVGVVWLLRIQAIGEITLYNVDFNLSGGLPALLRAVAAALTIFARTSIEVFGMFVQGLLPRLHGEIALMSVISLLPGHHPGLGLFHVSALLGYDPESGTTVSLFGGMFADFGVLGVAAMSPALGWVLGYLERRSALGRREYGLYYGIVLAYYINMVYGGQMLDVTLLWKLWLASIFLDYCRTGRWGTNLTSASQLVSAGGLYGFGVLKALTSG